MNHPIVYKIGEDLYGYPIYASNETKNIIQMALRGIWNHRPDYDPPTWKDFFDYSPWPQPSQWHPLDPAPDLDVDTTMEQVISIILYAPYWASILTIYPKQIEPNMEDIVEEFFHDLEPVTDTAITDQLIIIEDINLEGEEEEDTEEVKKRKGKVSEVQQILDEIMETKDQKLDQGKYLALCNLLRDVHQG